MIYRALFFAALFVLSGAAAAQPAFTVSPDTAWFSDPGEVAFSIASHDPDTLRFTFPETVPDPSVPRYGTESGVEWHVEMETPEAEFWFSLPYLFANNPIPDLRLAPGQTASFRIWGIDTCPFCLRPEASADTLADRLHIRVSNGAQADTAIVVLETLLPTPVEPGPEAVPPRLRLYPSPARDRLTVRIESDEPWEGEAVVLDVLGRTAQRFSVRTGAVVRLDLRSLSGGTYFVRIPVPGGAPATKRFVVLD